MIYKVVVYYSISTSNHNSLDHNVKFTALYIILFLHQTTTSIPIIINSLSCILFYFYIKPQLFNKRGELVTVVYYSISTSNHNFVDSDQLRINVVYYSISTSNHNTFAFDADFCKVVYYSISTSNHNLAKAFEMVLAVVYYSISTSNHNY